MPRTRIAVIGLGLAVTPHAKSLMDLADRVEVVAAVAPSAERRKGFALRFPFPTADDVDGVLADKSISAVMILTPPNTHLNLASRAARAGKHVLLEKPLEITTDRAATLVRTVRAAGVRLGCVLQMRFRPAGRRLIELVDQGALGHLVGASLSVRWWRPQSYYDEPGRGSMSRDGGGVLITQAIHALDLLLRLTGEVADVRSLQGKTAIHRMEGEDVVAAGVRYANGAIGSIDATTAAFPGFPERLELVGTKGTAAMTGGALEVYYQDGRRETIEAAGGTGGGADPMAFAHDAHRDLIADFLDAIEEKRDPTVTGEQLLEVHRLIDRLLDTGRPN
ncbi:MAG: Gfo/Idh/MocA family oxidoreductase [Proteobacteria bacterium]|nr:Gfo/Idh/MocA family oxidoreductase [Pseudomonadota bacterium]MBI3497687.1 Gfo/Idh/MocA family oxidoreductase [Pseudomonadota bacterium]